VLTWPDAAAVDLEIREWAQRIARSRPEAVRIGYFGSYARGEGGVGSDVDIVAVVESADDRFERRRLGWDTTSLSVPVDLLVYTREEFERLRDSCKLGAVLAKETVWVYERA